MDGRRSRGSAQQQHEQEDLQEEETSSQPEVRVSIYSHKSPLTMARALSTAAGPSFFAGGQQEYHLWRVPEQVRAINREAYEPKFVCIGPYHRRRPDGTFNNLPGERLKKYYLEKLLDDVVLDPGDQTNKQRLIECCKQSLHQNLDRVRRFYGEGDVTDMKARELVTMLLDDGCFIIKHLYNYANEYNEDYLYETRWAPMQLRIDMGLLENQLPFFVLEELFNILTPRDVLPKSASAALKRRRLLDMALWYMLKGWYPLPSDKLPTVHMCIPMEEEVHHLLHLFHLAHCVKLDIEAAVREKLDIEAAFHMPKIVEKSVWWWFPKRRLRRLFGRYPADDFSKENFLSAAQLQKKIGLNVRRRFLPRGGDIDDNYGDNYGGVLHVRFIRPKKTLEIPPLSVEQATVQLLPNLVAYEQQAGKSKIDKDYFTTYAFLLYNLVSTTEDVELLQEQGVLRNYYGSHDVIIDYFKNLCWGNQRSDSKINPIMGVLDDLRRFSRDQRLLYLQEACQYVNSPIKLFLAIISAMVTISTFWQTGVSIIYPKN